MNDPIPKDNRFYIKTNKMSNDSNFYISNNMYWISVTIEEIVYEEFPEVTDIACKLPEMPRAVYIPFSVIRKSDRKKFFNDEKNFKADIYAWFVKEENLI